VAVDIRRGVHWCGIAGTGRMAGVPGRAAGLAAFVDALRGAEAAAKLCWTVPERFL
jgi:hypothetical protein